MRIDALRALTVIGLLMSSCNTFSAAELPEYTVEGLRHIKDSKLAVVYVQEDADLGQYRRIYLTEATVSFKKNWRRSQNRSGSQRVSTSDMERIKADLATMFHEVFTDTLEQGGYEFAVERAEDVLIIKPAIINLDVVAPSVASGSISHTFAESSGEMTLYLEVYDSLTDDLIAKALDRELDRKTGYFEWRNRSSNRAAARRILKVWSNVMLEGLQEVRAIQPP